jgi:hypothetical protein
LTRALALARNAVSTSLSSGDMLSTRHSIRAYATALQRAKIRSYALAFASGYRNGMFGSSIVRLTVRRHFDSAASSVSTVLSPDEASVSTSGQLAPFEGLGDLAKHYSVLPSVTLDPETQDFIVGQGFGNAKEEASRHWLSHKAFVTPLAAAVKLASPSVAQALISAGAFVSVRGRETFVVGIAIYTVRPSASSFSLNHRCSSSRNRVSGSSARYLAAL